MSYNVSSPRYIPSVTSLFTSLIMHNVAVPSPREKYSNRAREKCKMAETHDRNIVVSNVGEKAKKRK